MGVRGGRAKTRKRATSSSSLMATHGAWEIWRTRRGSSLRIQTSGGTRWGCSGSWLAAQARKWPCVLDRNGSIIHILQCEAYNQGLFSWRSEDYSGNPWQFRVQRSALLSLALEQGSHMDVLTANSILNLKHSLQMELDLNVL